MNIPIFTHINADFTSVEYGGETHAVATSNFLRFFTTHIRSECSSGTKTRLERESFFVSVRFLASDGQAPKDIALGPLSHKAAKRLERSLWNAVGPTHGDRSTVRAHSGATKKVLSALAFVGIAGYIFLTVPLPSGADGSGSAASLVKAYSTKEMKSFGYLDKTEASNLKAIAESVGIPIQNGPADSVDEALPFYVLSRPGCEDCKSVDTALADVSPEFRPIVLPTAFDSDVEAMIAVSVAYCAADPGAQWIAMAKDKSHVPAEPASCDWVDKANVSVLMTKILGIASKPTDWPIVIAPNGAFHVGAIKSKNTPDAISKWLTANKD